jgi:hypothetical protein
VPQELKDLAAKVEEEVKETKLRRDYRLNYKQIQKAKIIGTWEAWYNKEAEFLEGLKNGQIVTIDEEKSVHKKNCPDHGVTLVLVGGLFCSGFIFMVKKLERESKKDFALPPNLVKLLESGGVLVTGNRILEEAKKIRLCHPRELSGRGWQRLQTVHG